MNANLEEYYDDSQDNDKEAIKNEFKSHLIDHHSGIISILNEVIAYLREAGWLVEHTYNSRSGFFETLKISTPEAPSESVQVQKKTKLLFRWLIGK